MNKLQLALTGIVGVAASNVAPLLEPKDIGDLMQVITQIAIAIVTLWKLIKKPRQ